MTHICRNPSAMIISCLMMFRHDVLVRYKVTYFKAILIDIYSLSHCQLHSDSYLFLLQKTVRPVENSSLPLNVKFDMSIHHIIDVDEKNQILTMNCWITQQWVDAHLTWNKSHFGGVDTIRLPYDTVWKPDIILYNK